MVISNNAFITIVDVIYYRYFGDDGNFLIRALLHRASCLYSRSFVALIDDANQQIGIID
jgi:hypothetical protein